MIFDKFFIGDSHELNWDYVNSLPEFQKLRKCKQNPKWHSEGTAWDHTVACLKAAYEIQEKDSSKGYWTLEAKRTRIMCVLFHDIGKGVTTSFSKGNWHSYGHEIEGEKITRRILWEEPINDREKVCAVVRYHMSILDLLKTSHKVNKMFEIILNAPIGYLLFTKRCDILGSKYEDDATWKQTLEDFETIEKTISPFHRYIEYDIRKEQKRLIFNNPISQILPNTVTVLIGLPGSGKDTFIKNHCGDETVISRDDIRYELGFCKKNEKTVLSHDEEDKVTAEFNRRLIEAVESGKDVIINNINLKKKYRDNYKTLLHSRGLHPSWHYVYIQAPSLEDNVKRRNGQISPDVIYKMVDDFDWPTADEYDYFTNSDTVWF